MAVHEENFQVSPEALTPGMEVNGWRIRERLGTGGFGVAYLVESTARPGEFFGRREGLVAEKDHKMLEPGGLYFPERFIIQGTQVDVGDFSAERSCGNGNGRQQCSATRCGQHGGPGYHREVSRHQG